MLLKFILYILFLCVAVRVSISKHHGQSGSIILKKQRINSDNFVLVDPKIIHHLEKSLQHFLSKIADPINGTIVLESRSKNGKDLQLSIRKMCESVRMALVRFADDCGLTNVVQSYKKRLNDVPLSEDWYSESLLQGAYILRDLGNMIDEIEASIELNFHNGNATLMKNKQRKKQTEDFQFLGVVYNAAKFSEDLSKCLLQMANSRSHKSSFTINRALLNLAKDPPKIALRTFKSKMNSISFDQAPKTRKEQKYWHVILCLSMTNKEGSYENCVKDLQKLDTCLSDLEQRSKSERKSFDANSWVKAMERLSDCKIRADKHGQVEVSCGSARRIPKRMKQKVSYLFERMLDKKISKKSPWHRVATDLNDALSKSKWGQRFVDELCQYLMILEDGQRKLKSFSGKDKTAMTRRKEIAGALRTYRKGMLQRTFNTICRMHQSITTFEQYLINGIKDTMNEAWQSHLKVLSSLIDWMTKLLEKFGGQTASENGQSSSDTSLAEWDGTGSSNSDDDYSEQSVATRSRPGITKEADISMKSLIESMNRVSRYRTNNNSTLSCLANNLLLVTIFMETIGFLSTLYCFDQAMKDDQNSADFDDKVKRARRSLPFDYKEIVNLVSQDYLLLEFNDNSTASVPRDSN